MSDQFLGEIRMVGFDFAPTGWALCDGSLLSISQNTALFSLLGTIYGGNGTTTFALPDLRGRVAIHQGQGPGLSEFTPGQSGGAETGTLTVANLPAHGHPVAVGGDQTTSAPDGALLAQDGAYTKAASTGSAAQSFVGQTGGGQPFSVEQPFLVVSFIIALQGIFPPRS